MRDINSHIDEYLIGCGRYQNNFEIEYDGRRVNAFSIDAKDGKLFIGGRINIHDLVNILIDIKPRFDETIENALKETFSAL